MGEIINLIRRLRFDNGEMTQENLAQRVGPGKKLEWDGPNMKITNFPAANAWLKRDNRPGWQA